MGVKRLIAVRVADGQIFAEHGALPHHADHTVGKAGKGRALIGGKVEAGMKGLLTCVRVLAPAEARGQRAVERRRIGKGHRRLRVEHIIRHGLGCGILLVCSVRLCDLRPAADLRGVLHTAAAKHGDVGIAEGLRESFGRGDRVADGGKCLGKVRVAHEPLGKRTAEGRKIPRQHELEQHERDKQRAADGQTQKTKLRRAGGLLFPAAASCGGASLCPRGGAAFSLCARPAAQTHPYGHRLFLPWLSFWDSLCRGIAAYARTQKKSRPPAALAVI